MKHIHYSLPSTRVGIDLYEKYELTLLSFPCGTCSAVMLKWKESMNYLSIMGIK